MFEGLKRKVLIITAAASFTVVSSNIALAQMYNTNPDEYYRAPSSLGGKTIILPAGTTFEGRIDNSIGSRISHKGERFTIAITSPVLGNGTDVLISAGSEVLGEVVEAIPSSSLPHKKKQPKPTGKLRVQLNGLKTPDGMVYPLVASMVGEVIKMGYQTKNNPALSPGVGYIGTNANFEAVAPGRRMYNRQPGSVVTKQQMLQDPIYGTSNMGNSYFGANAQIRSLVKRDHDLYIDQGSPITMRIDAPFKIGINPVNMGAPIQEPSYNPASSGSAQSPSQSAPSQPVPSDAF